MNPETQSSLSQLESNNSNHLVESTIQQPKKKRQGPFRGPSRALKYKKLRSVQPGKVKVRIPAALGSIVGDRANQFVAECTDWVKEICPLSVTSWNDMPEEATDRLYSRIKAKYDFSEADGAHIEKALRIQCSALYRHRRERLKAAYFSKSRNLKEVERACPATIDLAQWRWLIYSYWNLPKQRERSEKNRANALSKKIRSACGAKSIARTIYELELEAEAGSNEREEENEATNASSSNATTLTTQANGDPMYLKLWEKTKRHKNGKFDDEAEIKYNEFKQLHEKEVGEKGADNVSVDVAYEKVLGYRSGYARGLGKGHPVLSKDGKKGRAELEVTVVQLQNENNTMRAEFEHHKAETLRKENEAKKKQEELEQKLKLIMEKIGLESLT
ncbi:uncharacterized protein [Spinacia oleracea]|uniref:Uncharacterized protein isoform X1 n=2 Tax=Spinacia oleracea TaxID=3562 RepID=A0ABM3R1H1_SPIOL|nr:uncharacterized protein LOC130464090 isoform X1 [Spinacia oleracea]XP_056689471.1 uncharacterized protein LOC130464090 isoform X1 [Spinacia oleracea]XP_056695238.1 uncharacterized protein LOC110797960 isoform X1 [Spinacia oleracea]XP_056695239.1 uncharacterized protein LOC110797960 isoform X1 [Spinacia oleracea]